MKSQSKLFGTDGIRGKANEFPITSEIALRFGKAVAHQYQNANDGRTIIIGRDSRYSGIMLEKAVASGIVSMGCNVLLVGVLPTPAIAYLVSKLPAVAGIVISASHNPYEDNGLKVFQTGGLKCNDSSEKKLEELILGDHLDSHQASKLGTISNFEDVNQRYKELILKDFAKDLDLSSFKITVDAAHGAAYQTTPEILKALNAKTYVFNNEPDGFNINKNCGSNCPEIISKLVIETGADIGITHDGDADRACFCDETGSILDGDEVLAIFGLSFLKKGKLNQNTLVATVMSNLGLDECLKKEGAKVLRAPVGDRYVWEAMEKHQLNVGGEQSGHIILSDFNQTGDGLNTALQLLRIMKETGEPLSSLRRCIRKYPQLLINLPVREKKPLENLTAVSEAVAKVEKNLGDTGRVVLRYSGTEPKIRLLIEAQEKQGLDQMAEEILGPIRTSLGA